jgi:hypothetical protein
MNLLQLFVSSYLICLVRSAADAGICPWTPLHIQPFQHFTESDAFQLNLGVLYKSTTRENQNPIQWKWQDSHGCIGRFCVWSSETPYGDGLSVVTTNANIRLVQNMTWTDSTFTSPTFRTVQIANKGVGMIANKSIRRGERILAAKPAVLVHRSLIDELANASQQELLDIAMAYLSEEKREKFLAQAGELGGHRIQDIMFTNSFQINLGGHDGQHFGNFPDVSRFNHDCRPK